MVLALVRRHGMAYLVRLTTSRNPVTMGVTAMKGTEAMGTAEDTEGEGTAVVDTEVGTGMEEGTVVDMVEATDASFWDIKDESVNGSTTDYMPILACTLLFCGRDQHKNVQNGTTVSSDISGFVTAFKSFFTVDKNNYDVNNACLILNSPYRHITMVHR